MLQGLDLSLNLAQANTDDQADPTYASTVSPNDPFQETLSPTELLTAHATTRNLRSPFHIGASSLPFTAGPCARLHVV